MLLSAEHLYKDYGMKTLLKDVSLYLEAGDRVGVIGINGTGKSTLLRVLAGSEEADRGSVSLDPNVQVSFLRQDPRMDMDATVLEQVFLGHPAEFRQLREYEAKTMLQRLGIPETDRKVGTLSGGQRKRVALATALVHPADVLILDEPTNHLDTEMIEWLEETLRAFRGAVVMVTHDRYFLQRVSTRIAELHRGALYTYEGDYGTYLSLRQQREESLLASERKRQTLLRREYQWIIRGPQARGTKAKDRIRRYEELRDQAGPEAESRAHMAAAVSRMGKKTIELRDVSKSYDGKPVLQPFSCRLHRGQRIGIVGRNGAGKTTLLRMIGGSLEPDTGTVEIGETVRIGAFSQEGRELDPRSTPYDFIYEIAPRIETAEGTLSASMMLEQFLFDGELQHCAIGSLSGGEKRRLALLGVLMRSPNVLLLDEPTNDLDVETLTILEDYLTGFQGIIVAVSHDRYFLDKVAEQIFEVGGDGSVRCYNGGYTEYLRQRTVRPEQQEQPDPPREEKQRPEGRKKLRFSYMEQREYDAIEEEIAALEERAAALEKDMEAACTDYAALSAVTAEKEAVEAELEAKLERWMELSEKAQQIAAQDS